MKKIEPDLKQETLDLSRGGGAGTTVFLNQIMKNND